MQSGEDSLTERLIAIEPKRFQPYEDAVAAAGGTPCEMSPDVRAVIWTNYADPAGLHKLILENEQLSWVQLPFAGVDAFAAVIADPAIKQRGVVFTSAKGSYREPVAEHALALCLALGRKIRERVYAKSWGKKFAKSLYDSHVLIVGGGGITEELVKLLQPFRAEITVIRKHAERALESAAQVRVIPFEQLDSAIPDADFIVLAAALTPETYKLFDARRLGLMNPEAYLVNIARGPMIDTEALIDALNAETIAGAAVDVTDPEPLPEGHPLWDAKNVIITPHTADTNEMVLRMFSVRIRENVAAYLGQGDWVGTVSPELGY